MAGCSQRYRISISRAAGSARATTGVAWESWGGGEVVEEEGVKTGSRGEKN